MAVITCAVLLLLGSLAAQTPGLDGRKVIRDVVAKVGAAKDYSFEGNLQLVGQRGSAPARLLAQAKIKLAVAQPGRSYLHLQPVEKDEYLLVSSGEKTWTYVPKLKQYTEAEGATLGAEEEEEPFSDSERDLAETFARSVMPSLASLWKFAQAADMNGTGEVNRNFHFGSRYENSIHPLRLPASLRGRFLSFGSR
ncbi:MAG: hypothetical protein FJW37_06035, partial [Acidobacteria bacterium]|nr:hypothetical protein [Acidobacteriota bacterium]